MFKNKFFKFLAVVGLAIASIGGFSVVNNHQVQASTFHWLRKDHKSVTLGIGENLPIRKYDHGKLIQKDDPNDDSTYCDLYYPLKTHGWKYINGVKYYNIYNERNFDITSAYIKAKYFTPAYSDQSYQSVYVVDQKVNVLNDDMQKTDTNDWYGKDDVITVFNGSKNKDYVYTFSPMQDGKHNADHVDGAYDYAGGIFGFYMRHSDFVNKCHKASVHTRYYVNTKEASGSDDYYTNASLKRGGIYHNGKFYKYYSR